MNGNIRILIIEDEPSVSRMMARLLARAGCEVETSADAERGLKMACNGHFDVITLDIDLPGMNGIETCCLLKNDPVYRNIAVVFVSGRAAKEDLQRGFEVGAVDYIIKPFQSEDFVARVISHARPGPTKIKNLVPPVATA